MRPGLGLPQGSQLGGGWVVGKWLQGSWKGSQIPKTRFTPNWAPKTGLESLPARGAQQKVAPLAWVAMAALRKDSRR